MADSPLGGNTGTKGIPISAQRRDLAPKWTSKAQVGGYKLVRYCEEGHGTLCSFFVDVHPSAEGWGQPQRMRNQVGSTQKLLSGMELSRMEEQEPSVASV